MADQVIQDIKDRLNIADVIGGYIQLKKAGTSFKAVCPFHNEKTPSLQISPQKQIWHCFGCGEGGDVLGFVMKYENLEFKEALKILAAKAGVKLPEYRPGAGKQNEEESDRLLKINDFAARFYHEILLKDRRAERARAYLKERGLSDETIKQWKIGYAPDEFHALEQALVQKKVGLHDLVKAGVSSKNERGQVYDRFRGRVTFPIFNYVGEVVGFTARVLPEPAGEPAGKESEKRSVAKYINSPETPVYNKGKVLFGLNFAKPEIRKKDEIIIVEGQMDCIAAHQAGFKNVVASSGTALTLDQLALLGRMTKNLKFCFDADAAGLVATRRAIEMYVGKDFIIRIIVLKGAKDPDELIKKDPEAFAAEVKDAPLFLDYYIEKAFVSFDGKSVERKKAIAGEILPFIKHLTNPLEQDHYIQLMAAKLGTSTQVLTDAVRKASAIKKTESEVPARPATADVQSAVNPMEKFILGGLLAVPEFLDYAKTFISDEYFEHPVISGMVRNLLAKEPLNLGGSQDTLAKEAQFMVESELDGSSDKLEILVRELRKSLALLKLKAIRRRQSELQKDIQRAESSGLKEKVAELNKEFASLTGQRTSLEKEWQ